MNRFDDAWPLATAGCAFASFAALLMSTMMDSPAWLGLAAFCLFATGVLTIFGIRRSDQFWEREARRRMGRGL